MVGTIRSALIFGGADYETTFDYYEGMFDDMSVRDMGKLNDFFPDLDEWLYNESIGYITKLVREKMETIGYLSELDWEEINTAWQDNRQTFERKFANINKDLVKAFKALNERYIGWEDFPDFLEKITIVNDGDTASVSSPYGTIKYTRFHGRRQHNISRQIY